MKLNLHNILLSLGLSISASVVSFTASAQDMHYPSLGGLADTTLIDRDILLVALGEPEPRSKVSKDSLSNSAKAQANRNLKGSESNKAAAVSKAESEAAAKQDEDDDSILSFNFLYYIFQKYKLQDIVD